MTTIPRKTNSHKKAQAISPGFFELINTFALTPRQGIANKRKSFRTVVKNHAEDNSITVGGVKPVSVWVDESSALWFLQPSHVRGM